MSEIERYVVLDVEGHQESGEYDTLDEARDRAQRCGGAVEAHTYEWSDSELVWTPDGGGQWPPAFPPPEAVDNCTRCGELIHRDEKGGSSCEDGSSHDMAWPA